LRQTGRSIQWTSFLSKTLLSMTNDGLTWTLIRTIRTANNFLFSDSLPSQPTTGFVVGDSGTIFRTTDGLNWQRQSSPTINYLFSISMIDNGRQLYVMGGGGAILKTTNGGMSLVKQESKAKPNAFRLDQNYPNSFNPSTVIGYQVSSVSEVRLEVFDVGAQSGNDSECSPSCRTLYGNFQCGISHARGIFLPT
jgi:hypothetical protein